MAPPQERALDSQDDFADKLMHVAVRRISEERKATSHIERLSLAGELRTAAELRVLKEIARCRDSGVSWADIGAALGVSGQAAHRRYSGRSAPLDGDYLLDQVIAQRSEDERKRGHGL
ncbi:hypothetical protein ACFV1X_13730 [Streptomyces coelicoflavus]|uniref:hypothetical protein n=1 Tax=Streptomyces coelicoflavus TaxID=285562 RepID=UPI003691B719